MPTDWQNVTKIIFRFFDYAQFRIIPDCLININILINMIVNNLWQMSFKLIQ